MISLTGGYMLNFGYWDHKTTHPLQAQNELTTITGKFASLYNAEILVDIGSGYSVPAFHWYSQYDYLKIICININFKQLHTAISFFRNYKNNISTTNTDNKRSLKASKNDISNSYKISYINSTSTIMPLKSDSVDRIIAFESAQHFKPLIQFVKESYRILKHHGFLVIAMPVILDGLNPSSLKLFVKLGILSITWASEHYNLKYVDSLLKNHGFNVTETKLIGSNVYKPLARYYIEHREDLKEKVKREHSGFLEKILYRSLLKMEEVSDNGIIDYVLLKAQKI
jgi:SAM-dependent methyltransferase